MSSRSVPMRRVRATAAITAILFLAPAIRALYGSAQPAGTSTTVLTVRRASTAPVVDGRAEPLWDGVEPLAVPAADAEGSRDCEAILKALLAGNRLYLLARWRAGADEPARVPWEKRSDGTWASPPREAVKATEHLGHHTLEWSRPAPALSPSPEALSLPGIAVGDASRASLVLRLEPVQVRVAGDVRPPDAQAVARGEAIYRALCARCHSLDGTELYLNAKSFKDLNQRADDLVIWKNIRRGFADVRGYREEELHDLFTFLRSLK